MLRVQRAMEIRILHCVGKSIRTIAKELGISRERVGEYPRTPILQPRYKPREARPWKLGDVLNRSTQFRADFAAQNAFKAYARQRLADTQPHFLLGCAPVKWGQFSSCSTTLPIRSLARPLYRRGLPQPAG